MPAVALGVGHGELPSATPVHFDALRNEGDSVRGAERGDGATRDASERSSLQASWGRPRSCRGDCSAILSQQRFSVSYCRLRGLCLVSLGGQEALERTRRCEKKWLLSFTMITLQAHYVSSAEISPPAKPNWRTSVLTT